MKQPWNTQTIQEMAVRSNEKDSSMNEDKQETGWRWTCAWPGYETTMEHSNDSRNGNEIAGTGHAKCMKACTTLMGNSVTWGDRLRYKDKVECTPHEAPKTRWSA